MADTQLTDGRPSRYSTIPWKYSQRYGSHQGRDRDLDDRLRIPLCVIINMSSGKQNKMGEESSKILFKRDERLYY
jgi:hypothetical protein